MGLNLFLRSLTVASIAGVTIISQSLPSSADGGQTSFYCGRHNGYPTTMFGSNPFISWQSDYFSGSGYTPQRRCEIVSNKIESNRQSGYFRYILSGRSEVNGLPVLCAETTPNQGIVSCPDAQVLFTLQSSRDYKAAKDQLMLLNTDRNQDPLIQSGARIYNYNVLDPLNSDYVIDVIEWIRDLKPATSNSQCTEGAFGLCQ